MAEMKKVPAIRFKGFTGTWEVKSLGDEVADIVGGGTPNTFEPTYWDGNIDWYSPTEIGTKVFANGSIKKITELGLQNSSAKLLPAHKTILFTSRAGIGDMAILGRIGATNQGFQSLVLKDGYDPYFVYSMGRLIKDYAIKFSSGSTFLEISGKVLGRMVVKAPSLTEQEEIGSYFQHLDKLISLHQTKVNKLTNLKKAMLEKMFPKQGADVPEIRFKGFAGAWEEMKLSDMSDYKNGKGHEDKQLPTGKYELINLNSISIDGGLKHSGKYINETDSTLNKNDLVMVLSDVGHGDLLGRVALIPENNKYVLNQRVALLRPKQNVNPTFMFYDINAHQIYFKSQGAGMSQLNLSKGSVENFESKVPKISEEQEKIGGFFQNLDKLIFMNKSKLEKLKNLKKGCLEKMFI